MQPSELGTRVEQRRKELGIHGKYKPQPGELLEPGTELDRI